MEIDKKLSGIETQIDLLQQAINQIREELKEKPKKVEVWRPYSGGWYWWVYQSVRLMKEEWLDASSDREHYSCGNVYFSEAEANEAAQLEKALRVFRQLAKQVNGDWVPDWLDPYQKKFYVFTRFSDPACRSTLEINSMLTIKSQDTYFFSEKAAQLAVDSLPEDCYQTLFGDAKKYW